MKINNQFLDSFINKDDYKKYTDMSAEIAEKKMYSKVDMSGWIDYPLYVNDIEISKYIREAKKNNQIMVVIGIGGSYLGAAAAINLLQPEDKDKVFFIGPNMDNQYISNVLDICMNNDCLITVISKSGSTLETAFCFDTFKRMLYDKYHADFFKHICCITSNHGLLFEEAIINGYKLFIIPDNIGGRYSVLTNAGLIPMAFAGVNIDHLLIGAIRAAKELNSLNNDAYKYAIFRNILYMNGWNIELFVGYNESFQLFNEWLKQLFGESEGKDNKGLFPASVIFSRDLHSFGQYLQDGKKQVFETCFFIKNVRPAKNKYINNEYINNINKSIAYGAAEAHFEGGVPVIIFEIEEINPVIVGELFYFFEKACAMSAYLLGVNPFDQPGVELYKKNVKKLI